MKGGQGISTTLNCQAKEIITITINRKSGMKCHTKISRRHISKMMLQPRRCCTFVISFIWNLKISETGSMNSLIRKRSSTGRTWRRPNWQISLWEPKRIVLTKDRKTYYSLRSSEKKAISEKIIGNLNIRIIFKILTKKKYS